MKTLLFLLLSIAILCSCSSNNFEKNKILVKKVMDDQTESWNKGDLKGYMDGYWMSDSLRFLGKRGITKGWKKTLENYIKTYPDKKTMGILKFDDVTFEPLNEKQMFVVGRWTLEREKDTLSGYYSLIWKKFDSDWKIIFDHTN